MTNSFDYVEVREFISTLIDLAMRPTTHPYFAQIEELPQWRTLVTNVVRFTGHIYSRSRVLVPEKDLRFSILNHRISMTQALVGLRQAVMECAGPAPDNTLVAYQNREHNREVVIVSFQTILEGLRYVTVKGQHGENNLIAIAPHSQDARVDAWKLFLNYVSKGPVQQYLRSKPRGQRDFFIAVMRNLYTSLNSVIHRSDCPVGGLYITDAEVEAADLQVVDLVNVTQFKEIDLVKLGTGAFELQKGVVEILKMLRPALTDRGVVWVDELDKHVERYALRSKGPVADPDYLH